MAPSIDTRKQRALLVASVFQFFCFKLFRHIRPADSIEKTAYIVAAGAFVLTIWQQLSGLSIAILPDEQVGFATERI